MGKYFQFKQKDEQTTILDIFGDITSDYYKMYESDVGSFDFAKELKQVKTNHLTVRINSYGGEVAEGLAIYNLLKEFENVTTVNEGFACSAASVIFMAGKERVMKKASLLMIHNAWTFAMGDSNALEKTAEDLKKITQPSIEVYKSVSNLDESTIKDMMDKETWITADEAFEYGFATSISEEGAKQSLEQNIVANLVFKLKAKEKFEEGNQDNPINEWDLFFRKK